MSWKFGLVASLLRVKLVMILCEYSQLWDNFSELGNNLVDPGVM